jgi:hypothetical protein
MHRVVLLLAASLAVGVGCGGGDSKGAKSAADTDDSDKGLGEYVFNHGGAGMMKAGDDDGTAAASPDSLHFSAITKDSPVKLDGVLGEWPVRVPAQQTISGAPKATFSVALQYDDKKIYIGGEALDDTFVRTSKFGDGEDRASLLIAFPTSGGAPAAYEIAFYAGKPGESVGSVRFDSGSLKGTVVPGSKIVEAPIQGGYSFEASIPWTAIPEAHRTRVGLRGAGRYYDASAPGTIAGVLATGPGDVGAPLQLAALATEAELSMVENLLVPNGLVGQQPVVDRVADIAGDSMKERVVVYGKFLVVCGSSYLGGTKYYYKDLGGELTDLQLRDVTGRGKADIILRRRFPYESTTREWLEILSAFGADTEPVVTFAHEIAVTSGAKKIADSVRVSGGHVEVKADAATGWDSSSYTETVPSDVEPVLLPWGAVTAQSFKFDGHRFSKGNEITQTPQGTAAMAAPTAAAIRPVEPPTPKVRAGGDLSKSLFDLYKKERGVSTDVKPKADLSVNVGGDGRPERVVLIGKDIVVFGPGYKDGQSYSYVTISDAFDVREMVARDVTGDGNADLDVRVVVRRTAPGSRDPVDLDVLLVYQVQGDAITRIFAIETGRTQGKNRVQGLVQFIPSSNGKAFDIDAQPGRVTGWTEKSYPWGQEQPGSGSLEPVLLPWGGIAHVRYSWNGSAFTKL